MVIAGGLFAAGVLDAQTDGCGYPDNSNLPRSQVKFTANKVVRAFSPPSGSTVILERGESFKVWYGSNHALLLGVRRTEFKSGPTKWGTNYLISEMTSSPASATNPDVGSTDVTGDQSCTDLSEIPIFPGLYITDVTQDSNSRAKDWQQGGTGIPPHAIYGSWKSAVRKIDRTGRSTRLSIQADSDPAKNRSTLGEGSDDPPGGPIRQEFTTECEWNIDDLGLQSSHTYRFQVILHSGEQDKQGDKVGEMNVNFTIAGSLLPCTVSPPAAFITEGDSAVFTVIPGGGIAPYHFAWSTGDTTQSIVAKFEGIYQVTVVDAARQVSFCRGSLSVTPGVASHHIAPSPESRQVVKNFSLAQNYPNPFNPTTTIAFALPEPSTIRLSVYDILGREIAVLADGTLDAGEQRVEWNTFNSHSTSIAGGMYFYRLVARSLTTGKQFNGIGKMLLLK